MSDLNSLLIFAKVVEVNSFSEAALRLVMPVSTVSRRIADLEDRLGVRLLERSTRNLRVTDIGAQILEHAFRMVEVSEAVSNVVSNQASKVSGLLSLSAPPSISDTLIAPLVEGFQTVYPNVRVRVLITDRIVDDVVEGVDLMFKVGPVGDASLATRSVLRYRQQLVASPDYLAMCKTPPQTPQDLLQHNLLTFLHGKPEKTWEFSHINGQDRDSITFQPYLTVNDFSSVAAFAAAGKGIGHLPPVVSPHFLRDGRLVEVMPDWHFPTFDLSVVRTRRHLVPRPVRVFEDYAVHTAPQLFTVLPT